MPIILGRKPGAGGGGGAPSGPAGGDLSGTYPNPAIAAGSVEQTMMASGLVVPTVLFDSTLGGAAASIDSGAGGFSGSFNVLEIFLLARTTQATVQSSALLRFNNDSAANYDHQRVGAQNATAFGAASVAATEITLLVPGANAHAGAVAAASGLVPGYAQTTLHKQMTMTLSYGEDTANDNLAGTWGGRWRNTAAITRVQVLSGSGNLVAGSRLLIYGR